MHLNNGIVNTVDVEDECNIREHVRDSKDSKILYEAHNVGIMKCCHK